ncbi:hypothetical protein FHS42_002170 [Streptomyces zagrosensis]|uniref:Uncharacterized protein n=1 Tax=Streptomyces zagrosensis TaxID=1042984 RepID=A0A7W9Q7N5_9ACTN|nr:hypothetical protein [Streptomyces zagrosensis]MBB5935120.1 hypothetical protein [Streptomyces zagrosensis]
MSLMMTLARMEAVRSGRALPAATVRHRHIAEQPLVFVPLITAGEAGAPLGALVGTDRDAPRLLVVPQPRDRDLRFAFLAALAEEMLPHFAAYADEVELQERKETDPETGKRVTVEVELCADAPQLLVPSGPGIDFVRLLGRSMRFRRATEREPEGPAAPGVLQARPAEVAAPVAGFGPDDAFAATVELAKSGRPSEPGGADGPGGADLALGGAAGEGPVARTTPARVPLLGRWLTHYGERARVPGSSLLLALTDLLGQHWASGQSRLEDQHLGALLAWIDPAGGLSGAEAALRAEVARDRRGQLLCPPAGPATDPAFDNRLLGPAMARYDAARAAAVPQQVAAAEQEVRALIAGQLRPTWDALWHGLDLLRALPPGSRVGDRWKRDRWSYTGHRDRVRAGEPPQPKWDDAVTAARKLSARETAQAQLDAQEALDDPLIMAARRLAGEAFAGEVTEVVMAYSEAKVPRPRPLVTLRTSDRPLLDEGTKVYRALADGKTQTAEFVAYETDVAAVTDVTDVVDVADAQLGAGGRDEPAEPDGRGAAGDAPDTGALVLRLTGGMGRGKAPEPGSVPERGDQVCWTLFEHAPRGGPDLPEPEHTPWTHGGPPVPAEPAVRPAEGAQEHREAGHLAEDRSGTGRQAEERLTADHSAPDVVPAFDAGPALGAAGVGPALAAAGIGTTVGPRLALQPDPVTDEDFL